MKQKIKSISIVYPENLKNLEQECAKLVAQSIAKTISPKDIGCLVSKLSSSK
jgi:hypothetical protein